jgi:hypothetical protein
MSADGRFVVSASNDGTIRFWLMDWDLEERPSADWDIAVERYLEVFLEQKRPYANVAEGPKRHGRPAWSDGDSEELVQDLGRAGYGFLRPESVKEKLEEMAAHYSEGD